jgi:cell division protein FtsB
MSANYRRNSNLLPAAKLLLAFCLLMILGGGGFYYVNAKNELHKLGEYRKKLEREIDSVANRNEMMLARIATLSSYDALRKRQQQERDVFAKLTPVPDTAVVHVRTRPVVNESEVRTVSNPQPVR